jgi:hypothetical protein
MKYHWILLPAAIASIVAGCSVEQGGGAVLDEDVRLADLNDGVGEVDWVAEVEGVGSITQSLPKGEGGKNGEKDYCDATHLCASGEGDCDAKTCLPGLVCPDDNGPNFGLPSTFEVCVPSHCNNKVVDAGSGETGVDCGGPCGTCQVACSTEPALDKTSKEFCKSCLCGQAQGDCDGDAQCNRAGGFVCVNDVGPRFGYPLDWDLCLKSHCRDKVQNFGETGIDVGGECSPGPIIPPLNVFFSEYIEGTKENHHVEIYNAGSVPQNCTVNVYYDGSKAAGSTHALSAPVNPGAFFVLCRSGGSPRPWLSATRRRPPSSSRGMTRLSSCAMG